MAFNNYSDVQAALDAEYLAWEADKEGFKKTQEAARAAEARQWWSSYTPPPAPAPSTPPPPPPPPGPALPTFSPMSAPDKNIKEAPSDIIQFDDDGIEIALIQDLLFEDIGAVELANISREDLIDGQSVIYSPIKNLATVRQEFNPNNVIATSFATNYFSRFGINIDSRGIYEPYFDESGNLIIEIENVQEEEEIQVQIVTSGTIDLVDEI